MSELAWAVYIADAAAVGSSGLAFLLVEGAEEVDTAFL